MPLDLPVPGLRGRSSGLGSGRVGGPVKAVVEHLGHRHTLWVLDLALACCAVEYLAAATEPRPQEQGSRAAPQTGFDILGAAPFPREPSQADVLVVSGTVTDAMAAGVRAAYESMGQPRYVISFGACSNTGGPYWDSYSVLKGVDQVVPVDVYVPGCPPRPEALLHALAEVQRMISAGGRR